MNSRKILHLLLLFYYAESGNLMAKYVPFLSPIRLLVNLHKGTFRNPLPYHNRPKTTCDVTRQLFSDGIQHSIATEASTDLCLHS
jgi:hypothetical protein